MIVVIGATNVTSENRIMNARTINRIELFYRLARVGFLLALGVLALSALFATGTPVKPDNHSKPIEVTAEASSLKPPDKGPDSGRVSDFRRRGRNRLLRAVGSFPGCHGSRPRRD